MTIRVLLADDHRMFRETLGLLLGMEADIQITGEAGTGTEFLELLRTAPPDVAVLDINLPDMSGIELAQYVSSNHPGVGIVALSGYSDRMFVEEMLKAGARAYVLKAAGGDDLVRAIRAVHQGQAFLSPEIAGALLPRSPTAQAEGPPPLSVLSKREQEVLALVAAGHSSEEIAQALGITAATANVHRRNLKAKLGLRSVAELTRYAIR
ncbi:MAG TPA: response regulator transcription factor, partial [Azospira sp.]|nr:response regulator transcription factor [Azospira sp.]